MHHNPLRSLYLIYAYIPLLLYLGYDLWAGGQPDFQYAAAGDSSDYMYASMGVASFGLELGEKFYEDCGHFEDVVLQDNINALFYAATVAKKPFSLVKGPDIIDLDVNEQDGIIQVTVVASDSLLVNSISGLSDVATGEQGIAKVQLFLDVYPDDYKGGDITWEMQSVGFEVEEQTFELETTLPNGLSGGRHTMYAQAMDEGGYLGPVASAFFDVEIQPTPQPSKAPTAEPSDDPTAEPSYEVRIYVGCDEIQ